MTDDELKALVASLAISQTRTDEKFALLAERMNQTDEQMKRTDEQMKLTDEQIKLTGEQMKLTDEQMKRTDEKLERIGITLGNVTNNQGDVAEEFFYNSLLDNLNLGDLQFDDIGENLHKQRGKVQEEYDIILTNGDEIAIIEVKYKAHKNDLDKLDRKIANFKTLFPVYQHYKLYGAMASFHFNKEAKTETLNRGYFLLQRKGDVLETESEELKVA